MVGLSVSPGTYTVTGHSPLYGSDAYLCQADTPVTVVAEGHPPNFAHVSVYCQEK
jgi:hypothetical protein